MSLWLTINQTIFPLTPAYLQIIDLHSVILSHLQPDNHTARGLVRITEHHAIMAYDQSVNVL